MNSMSDYTLISFEETETHYIKRYVHKDGHKVITREPKVSMFDIKAFYQATADMMGVDVRRLKIIN